MRIMRVQRISLAKSGLAADNTVNTMYFRFTVGPPGGFSLGEATAVTGEIDTLFNTAVGAGTAVRVYIAESQHATQRTAYKCYDMDDPSPRVPSQQPVAQNVTPVIATAPLPSEVACCLSYKGAAVSGSPMASRRGRFFVGPLNVAAAVTHATLGHAIPNSTLMVALTAGANRMKDNLAALAQPIEWVVYSPKLRGAGVANDGCTLATEAWVDNEFDIQRRRGHVADNRTSITL